MALGGREPFKLWPLSTYPEEFPGFRRPMSGADQIYSPLDTPKRSRSELHEPASEADPWRNESVIRDAFFLVVASVSDFERGMWRTPLSYSG